MITNQKVTGKAMPVPGGIALGAGLSMAINLLLCWLGAWLIGSGRAGENAMGYISMAILLLSAYAGATLASAKIKHRHMMSCALSGLAYFACLLSSTALFFGGQYQGIGISALLIAAGSVAAAITQAGVGGNRTPKSRSKIRSR